MTVGEHVRVGQTVRLQVRDGDSADEDLRAVLDRQLRDLRHPPAGALLFTCNGRGAGMFGVEDHDASALDYAFAGAPAAGFFCAGEIGPVGRPQLPARLHGHDGRVRLARRSAATPAALVELGPHLVLAADLRPAQREVGGGHERQRVVAVSGAIAKPTLAVTVSSRQLQPQARRRGPRPGRGGRRPSSSRRSAPGSTSANSSPPSRATRSPRARPPAAPRRSRTAPRRRPGGRSSVLTSLK